MWDKQAVPLMIATVRRWLVTAGIGLVTVAALGFIAVASGAIPEGALAIGQQSDYRTLAEIAVVGCLLAAIGYWND